MKTEHEKFLGEVERYLLDTGLSAVAFSVAAMNNKGFVTKLRRGSSPTLTTVDRIKAFMRENPPPRKRTRAA